VSVECPQHLRRSRGFLNQGLFFRQHSLELPPTTSRAGYSPPAVALAPDAVAEQALEPSSKSGRRQRPAPRIPISLKVWSAAGAGQPGSTLLSKAPAGVLARFAAGYRAAPSVRRSIVSRSCIDPPSRVSCTAQQLHQIWAAEALGPAAAGGRWFGGIIHFGAGTLYWDQQTCPTPQLRREKTRPFDPVTASPIGH
jgi:hypothetical protein